MTRPAPAQELTAAEREIVARFEAAEDVPESLRERVARAIFWAEDAAAKWDYFGAKVKDDYRRKADAAIDAMQATPAPVATWDHRPLGGGYCVCGQPIHTRGAHVTAPAHPDRQGTREDKGEMSWAGWAKALADPAYRQRVSARFAASYIVSPEGCWEWQRHLHQGYGNLSISSKKVGAHRVSLALHRGGTWPSHLQVDHLCRNRSCVNPEHLELVTRDENYRRGLGPYHLAEWYRSKTHCPQNHPYDEANTYRRPAGHRACRACRAQRERLRRGAA